ncbi:MAG: peptidase U32 family protein [Desulfobacteraceae bacterium]|nr:peptidase U32 family protein [Desulfobacteraceae bacterium]
MTTQTPSTEAAASSGGRPAPEILAPAGNPDSFLAALAAGADAIYCGLKNYSARMAAENFTFDDLAALTALAHSRGVRVYVTLNVMLKPDELDDTGRLIGMLTRQVAPDAIIFQDLAVVELARQAGFSGELHLSTLANVSFPQALALVRSSLEVDRVVIPRELSIDEIRSMAAACPAGLRLEAFIHGALCYAVSGRCYWSSFLGGRSGLRGRCVQPCRRRYEQDGRKARAFSCQDLSLDVLVKVLKTVDQVAAWKIEGRKKGPHYVYYTTAAYRLLRDEGHDPRAKRDALSLLSRALGRPGTHYRFLPQRPQHPVAEGEDGASGLLVGRVRGGAGSAYLAPREALLAGDMVRIGYEDDPWHAVVRIGKAVPKGGRFQLKPVRGKWPPKEAPVFLIDRREPALAEMIEKLKAELPAVSGAAGPAFRARLPKPHRFDAPVKRQRIGRELKAGRDGCWLDEACLEAAARSRRRLWWWLPPVIWPDETSLLVAQIQKAMAAGAAGFVLNAPWQRTLFPDRPGMPLWAGPFCNLANPLALEAARRMGFDGGIVSPELGADALQGLPKRSPLPVGIVLGGSWPLCVARTVPAAVAPEKALQSPKGETAWGVVHGANYWLYPNWVLDLKDHEEDLIAAGYRLLILLEEELPAGVSIKERPGLWNWGLGLR